ncbi:AlbA family DNA-binding domain-containing protein [Staphylococcus aureus]
MPKGLSNDICSTYSAFANTEGGTIYLGIEEKKDRGTKKSLFQLVLKIQRK